MPLHIEGLHPILGTVTVSGAKNSALKLIFASMFSNEDIVLDNVPKMETISVDLEIIRSIGGKADWIGEHKLLLNGKGIDTSEIPYEIGSKYRTTLLLAGPLLYRFGEATIPKYASTNFKSSPINRLIDTWKDLGFDFHEDDKYIKIKAITPKGSEISFKTSTHIGTDNAILCALFLNGDSIINNSSEEPEIDDLIKFCNLMGASIERIETRKIQISGKAHFNGCTFDVMPDKNEAVIFSIAAILTDGNVIIKGIDRLTLVPFVNFLTKIGANYDFSGSELKVWKSNNNLNSVDIQITPSPGIVPDWQPMTTLILNNAVGISSIHDTVYTDRFSYIRDLNRMGAKMELIQPSKQGIISIISDDDYDFYTQGEPFTLLQIHGPNMLHGEKIHILDSRYAHVYVLAALAAEGRSELHDYRINHEICEGFLDKLVSLGAKIKM